MYAPKDFVVGEGSDAIVVENPAHDPRGQVVSATLQKLEEIMHPGATLLALPEGASLNYWLRRTNPTRYNLFLPEEIDAFGGDELLAAAISAPTPRISSPWSSGTTPSSAWAPSVSTPATDAAS